MIRENYTGYELMVMDMVNAINLQYLSISTHVYQKLAAIGIDQSNIATL